MSEKKIMQTKNALVSFSQAIEGLEEMVQELFGPLKVI